MTTLKADWGKYLVGPTWTMADVMRKIDLAESRVIFVENNGEILGSISDGDVRRAVLSGLTLNAPASEIMKMDFVRIHADDSPVTIHQLFTRGVSAIPRLDADGKLMDILFEQSRSVIPLYQPEITPREVQMVNDCLRSGWISSAGRYIQDFETMFSGYIGANSSVAVTSGTTALVLALSALGIGDGDEVIVPDLTFGATANAIVQVGAVPVFVDVERETWCLDHRLVAAAVTSRTKALMPVHLYGRAANMEALNTIATSLGLLVIEDCAEAIGTYDSFGHVGAHSDAAAFSFFANKTITTGEGGMVCFRSTKVAERARVIRSHGFSPHRRYWHQEWGSNFRMTNLQAAIGVAQMERVADTVKRKRSVANDYRRLLTPLLDTGLELPQDPPKGLNSYWLFTVLLPEGVDPEVIVGRMMTRGVECRRVFYPLHLQPAFEPYVGSTQHFGVSDCISARGLSLPSWPGITPEEQSSVAEALCEALADEC